MARWRLTEPHYLRVPGTKWEYNEVDRITGRPKRTQFDVPQLLDPRVEDDLRAFGQGTGDVSLWDIIVTDKADDDHPKDILFIEKDGSPGRPTPGMLPIDDDAKAISGKYAKVWDAPQEDMPSYSQRLEERFISQMAELQANTKAAPQAEGMGDFMKAMTEMMAKQTEILAQIAKAPPAQTRKVA